MRVNKGEGRRGEEDDEEGAGRVLTAVCDALGTTAAQPWERDAVEGGGVSEGCPPPPGPQNKTLQR